MGAFIGKHYFAVVTQKSSQTSQSLSAIFLLAYITAKNIWPTSDYFGKPFVKIVILMLAAYSMWSVLDLFMDRISPRPMFARSFAVFAMHVNVSAIIYKIFYLIFPKNGFWALPNFLATVIVSLAAINIFCIVFERLLPKTYALFMGKGIKKVIKTKGNKIHV
ncbi:MAG: hypothetical protein IJZ02_00320 [Clostridia bacterium]|nr:hypothetical protein [Clostridia bacterium]